MAGGNISHKLRLSSVKPSDEGTYECRVIDFSGAVPQHHRVRAYLRVEPVGGLGSNESVRLHEEEEVEEEELGGRLQEDYPPPDL